MPMLIPTVGAEYPGDIYHQTRVGMSLTVATLADLVSARVAEAINVADVFTYEAAQALAVTGKTEAKSAQSVTTKQTGKYQSATSLLVGGPFQFPVRQSAQVLGGDSFLVIADIVSNALSGDMVAENNVQIITLGEPTSGTWKIWLNYGGQVLETADIDFDATYTEVRDALAALDNVPSADCLLVTVETDGFRVEFTEAMGHRYINPLMIDTISLVTTQPSGIGVVRNGRALGSYSQKEVKGQLKIDDEIVDFKDFQFQQPENKLGSLLNIKLVRPLDISKVQRNADIEFSLIVQIGEAQAKKVLVRGGKLAGRDFRLAYRNAVGGDGGPVDELSFSSVDLIADKFTLAPRRPVIMYDPRSVEFSRVEVKPRNAIVNELGQPILPIYEPVLGLNMMTGLIRAYTSLGGHNLTTPLTPAQLAASTEEYLSSPTNDLVGLGFSNVITNIPNYNVKQVTFDIEGSWHSGVQPLIGMYNPMFLPFFNTLYIINAEFRLPYGAMPRVIPTSRPKSLVQTIPYQPDANAVLVTYQVSAQQDDADNTYVVGEYEYENENTSDQRITTRTLYQRKRDISTNELIAEVIDEVYKETRTNFGDGFFTTSHRETTKNFYANDIKTGHRKDVSSLILTGPDRSGFLTPILREELTNFWVDDPFNVGRKLLGKSITRVTGLVYEMEETVDRYNPSTGTDDTVSVSYPLIVAQQSNLLGDPEATGSISTSFRPLETTTETLRRIGGNQFDVEVVTIDEITRTVKRSTTAPRTGDNSSNPYETRAKTMLIRDYASEAEIGPRVPLSINTGELPQGRAMDLANMTLFRAHNPLGRLQLPLLEVDFGIEKGTIITGQTRDGYTTPHIVVAIDISGQGGPQPKTQMTVDGMELPEWT